MPVTVSRLLQSEGGVVIGLGSPLVSGLADSILLQLQQPFPNLLPVPLPFQFWWDFIGPDKRIYHKYVGPGKQQGIAWDKQLRIKIPSWGTIDSYEKEKRYEDGCVIVVWPTLVNQRRTWFVLVMGFMGPGTMGGASFLFSDTFGKIFSEYWKDLDMAPGRDDPAMPLYVPLKVVCKKQGPPGSREVYPVETVEANRN